ncbi:hypothetical protein Mapa_003903 [Marchantia paleacea]|nr:hypothetical protein Mapa_003903 [Marchantia paleacea]
MICNRGSTWFSVRVLLKDCGELKLHLLPHDLDILVHFHFREFHFRKDICKHYNAFGYVLPNLTAAKSSAFLASWSLGPRELCRIGVNVLVGHYVLQ